MNSCDSVGCAPRQVTGWATAVKSALGAVSGSLSGPPFSCRYSYGKDLMLIETQVVRSKFELMNEIQRMPIAKAVVCRKIDRKTWEAIAKEHAVARVLVVMS